MNKRPSGPASPRQLDVYTRSLELTALLQRHLERLSRALRDQAQRAVPSVTLNLAEALGRKGKDRAYHLSIALGSAREVRAIADVALASGMIDAGAAGAIEACGDRVCAMLHALRARS